MIVTFRSKVLGNGRVSALAVLVMVGGLGACDSLLEVSLPGQMIEETVFTPVMAETTVLSAVAAVECGYSTFIPAGSGREDAWWRTSALYGGWAQYQEERASTTSVCVTGGSAGGWYMGFQSGRNLAERVYPALQGWSDTEVENRERLMAVAAAYAGIAYQVLGEVFCELAVDAGPLMSQEQVLKKSEQWLTTALNHLDSTGDFAFRNITPSMRQLTHLIRARVRLDLGTKYAPEGERATYLAGAAADAGMVQPGFTAYITRDGTPDSRRNTFYWNHSVNTHGSIAGPQIDRVTDQPAPFTGYRDLRIDAAGRAVVNGFPVVGTGTPDPRVPVSILEGHFGNDSQTQMYLQHKYESYGEDIPLARWAEAQLILAEIEGGQSAVDRINALRDVHQLPHFSSTDEAEIRDAIIEERRREFFLEGRFWNDKLRFNLWFPRGIGLAIPERRGTYGRTTCMLMPMSEYENNPNLQGGPDGSQWFE